MTKTAYKTNASRVWKLTGKCEVYETLILAQDFGEYLKKEGFEKIAEMYVKNTAYYTEVIDGRCFVA